MVSSRIGTSIPVTATLPLYAVAHPDGHSSEIRMEVLVGRASPGASLDGGIDMWDKINCKGVSAALVIPVED